LHSQTDANSCGVFVAITAAYWIMNQLLQKTLVLKQQHMPKLRLHIVATLFENEIFNILYGEQQQRNDDYID